MPWLEDKVLRVLFSGASSFTGFWFVRELRSAGHEVVCAIRGPQGGYDGLRGWRVAQVADEGPAVYDVTFGEASFLALVADGPWDVYCHHAAEVANYRSMDFDPVGALASNTRNLRQVLVALRDSGCRAVQLTGSVFEGGEGAGSDGLPSILPYGLSKALTWQLFEYEANQAGITLGKLVIPNPIGPYQEPRFVEYLMSQWRDGRVAHVSTPAYVRDNIHVDLLAREYRDLLETLPGTAGVVRRNPSGIVGEQGAFAHLVAREMRQRLGWDCELKLATQREFLEPVIRVNTESAAARHPGWDPSAAWDLLAEYQKSPTF